MSNEKSFLHDMLSENYILKRNKSNGNLVDYFRLVATNRFEWTNLPNGIESAYIENFLYDFGQVAFFDDELNGFMCLPSTTGNKLNVYGQPTFLNVKGIGYQNTIDINNCVRIKANDLCKPLISYVNQYVYLLDVINNIAYKNLKQQRFPYIIPCNKSTELTLKKIYDNFENDDDAIFVDEKLNMSNDPSIKVLETKAPYLLDKLRQEKNEVKSELYTILGINNASNEKRERLLVDEVNVNNGQILMSLEMEYKHRSIAAELINKKYGLDIKVEKVIDKLGLNFLGSQKNIGGGPDDNE